jgi:hypothetical protein
LANEVFEERLRGRLSRKRHPEAAPVNFENALFRHLAGCIHITDQHPLILPLDNLVELIVADELLRRCGLNPEQKNALDKGAVELPAR